MASRGDIEAGRAFVTLFLKNRGVKEGLNQMATQVRQVGRAMGSIGAGLVRVGAATVAPLATAVLHTKEVRDKLTEISEGVGASLAKPFLELLGPVERLAKAFAVWAENNQQAVVTLAKVGTGLLAIGAAFKLAGSVLAGVSGALRLAAIAASAIGPAVAVATSPVGLLVGALAAGGIAWARYTESGQKATATLAAAFAPMLETIKAAVKGVGDALLAGDLTLAGQIAIRGLQLVFAQGANSIADALGRTLGDAVGDIGTRILGGDLTGAWQTTILGMKKLWADFSQGIVRLFAAAADAVVSKWQSTANSIATGLLKASAAGGAMGKIASLIVGADVDKIAAENERLNSRLGINQSIFDIGNQSVQDSTNAMAEPIKAFLDEMVNVSRDASKEATGNLKAITKYRPNQLCSRIHAAI